MLKFPKLFVNHVKALATPTLPNIADYLSQQTRNTFILKRRHAPMLHKKNRKHQVLRVRHFIYDLVEDTNMKKKEPLDLILTQYVAGLGNAGTKVSISPVVAYPKLLLPKLAEYATPENIEKYTKLATEQEDKTLFSSASVEKTIKILERKRILIEVSKNIPWTLEKWHIKANFRKVGIVVPEDAITMPQKSISGPNLDIEGKEFYVTLKINNHEEVKVRCIIHHWSSSLVAQIALDTLSIGPLFPEDKPILDSLPRANKIKRKDNVS